MIHLWYLDKGVVEEEAVVDSTGDMSSERAVPPVRRRQIGHQFHEFEGG